MLFDWLFGVKQKDKKREEQAMNEDIFFLSMLDDECECGCDDHDCYEEDNCDECDCRDDW